MKRSDNSPELPSGKGFLTRTVSVIILICTLAACSFGKMKADEHFNEEDIRAITPGRTTSAEVIRKLGIPIAVAQKGKTVRYPTPDIRKVGSVEKPGDVFMDIFTPKHQIKATDKVYYYYSVELSSSEIFVGAIIHNSKVIIDELWILIDGESNTVTDYIFEDR